MGVIEIICIILAILIVIVTIANIIVWLCRRGEKPVEEAVEEQPVVEEKPEDPAEEAVVTESVEEKTIVNVYNVYNYTDVVKEEPHADEDDNADLLAALESGNVVETDSGASVRAADGTAIFFRYNKSFTAKLIQAKDEVRDYYNELKNFVLSYKKVATRISWDHENVHRGRDKICWFVLRGKSLYLYLPLDPDVYADTKYKVERSEAKRYEELPCLYKIKNQRRVNYAKELIATVMERLGLEQTDKADENFVKDYPYEETLPLIKRGLIKVTKSNKTFTQDELEEETVEKAQPIAATTVRIEPRTEIKVYEAKRLMLDEEVEALIVRGTRKSDNSKKGIINIDVLSDCFEDGETVTLEDIKKRVKNFDKKTTYIKVLARGTLKKRLTVEADEFSSDAAKMILLMGGQVIKTLP